MRAPAPRTRPHRLHSRPVALVAAVVLTAALTACNSIMSTPAPPTPSSSVIALQIDQGSAASLDVGQDLQLTATVTVSGDASTAVVWSSGAPSIASVSATGRVTGIAEGTTTIVARSAEDPSKVDTLALTVSATAPARAFDIEIVYFDESFTPAHKQAFADAEALWERVIVGDLADVAFSMGPGETCGRGEPAVDQTIDDVLIFATSFTEGSGGLLGSAGPCWTRTGGDRGTTIVGFMRFDTADLDDLLAWGNLGEVVAHEMGHVLGIGTYWEASWLGIDLLDYQARDGSTSCRSTSSFSVLPTYTGASGVDAWQADLGGSGGPPVEDSGGPGTQCGHWDEGAFGNELMTGYINAGVANPLSVLSAASLQDLSYTVDTSAAEPYAAGAASQQLSAQRVDLASGEELLVPRGGIDPESGDSTRFVTR